MAKKDPKQIPVGKYTYFEDILNSIQPCIKKVSSEKDIFNCLKNPKGEDILKIVLGDGSPNKFFTKKVKKQFKRSKLLWGVELKDLENMQNNFDQLVTYYDIVENLSLKNFTVLVPKSFYENKTEVMDMIGNCTGGESNLEKEVKRALGTMEYFEYTDVATYWFTKVENDKVNWIQRRIGNKCIVRLSDIEY